MATAYPRTNKDGSTTWYTKVYDPNTGRRDKPRALAGVRTKTQAKRLADEIETEEQRLEHGLATGTRFRGTFHQLCKWAHEVHFSLTPSSYSDANRLKVHAGPATTLGRLQVEKVTTKAIADYLADYAKTTTIRGTAPSGKSINRIRAWYSAVFRVAAENKIWPADANPARAVIKREEIPHEAETLRADEVARVVAELDEYWIDLVATALLAGLRKGELYALQKRDVDLAGRVIKVRRSHESSRTKGSLKPEAVPVHEALVPYLERALSNPGPLMFPGRDGEQRPRDEHAERVIQRAMVRAGLCDWYDHKCRRCRHVERHADGALRHCPECGFKLWPVGHARHVTLHGARHTCATLALKSGASIASVQKILRHKDPRLTLNTYGHLAADHLVDEINRVRYAGFATPSEPVPPVPTPAQAIQRPSTRCEAPRPALRVVGATLVHEPPPASSTRPGVARTQPDSPAKMVPADDEGNTERRTGGVTRPVGDLEQVSEPVGSVGKRRPRSKRPSAPVGADRAPVGAPLVREGSPPLVHGAGATPPVAAALLSVREVAARLNLSTAWVYKAINRGVLEYTCLPGRHELRVPLSSVEAFVAAQGGLRDTTAPPTRKREPMTPAASRRRKAGA